MSPELIAAVKERIEKGYTKDAISSEFRSAGYSESVIDEVLKTVQLGDLSSTEYPAKDLSANLPRASVLFKNSFDFIKNRPDLCLVLTTPLLILVTLGYFLSNYLPATYLGLLSVIALVLYVMMLGASLYIISERQSRTISLGEAFLWVKKNIWGLVWVYVLAASATYGGFLLFIIPGIIVSFFVYLSQYVYVKEGVHGLDALLRSRDLIRGNWWLVVGRLVKVGLMFLGVFLILGLLAGLFISIIYEDSSTSELVLTLVMQFISSCTVLMGLHIGMDLYSHLALARPIGKGIQSISDRWKYQVLVALGFLVVTLVSLSLMILVGLNGENDLEIDEPTSSIGKSAKERAAELRSNLQQDMDIETVTNTDTEVLEATIAE